MTSVLDFINRVRTILGADEVPCIWLNGTVQDDVDHCVLACAFGVPVVPAEAPAWSGESQLVLQLPYAATARRVGVVCGLPWIPEAPQVALPEAALDLAVSHHYGVCEQDSLGVLTGWWVPTDDQTDWEWHTPEMELIPGDCGAPPRVAA